MDKTVRSNNDSVISSGVDPAKGGTRRADDKIITSRVQPQGPQVISAGITDLTGEITLNNNTYRILKPISASGEAEVFLLEGDNIKSVFKYYYSMFKPKDSVLAQLKGIHHEDIVDLLDYGYHSGRFFEILEYAEGGSLLDVNEKGEYKYLPIRDMEKIKRIVDETVNALHFCHSKNMIHRDIKPGNLFFKNPDGTDILIGDFGISSALDEGLSKRMTGKARTAVYAAPELYQSVGGKTIVGKETDYYSVGISLIHIWAGEEPFKELGELSIMRIKSESKVDIPDNVPEEIGSLIRGLITVEPPKRWGYDEVQKWLKGEHVPVQVSAVDKRYKDFHFGVIDGQDIVVNTSEELATLLEKYPDKGKIHLYKGTIQKWLEEVNQSLYIEIRGIVEDEYPKDEDTGLTKAIYALDPGKPFKSSGGVECKNAATIGDQIEKEKSYYKTTLINNSNADLYMFLEAQGYKKEADTFRNYAKLHKNDPEVAINNIILDLHGRDKFWFEGKIFHRPEDFLVADDDTKTEIVSMLSDPQSRLSIWLEGYPEIKGNQDKFILAIKEGAEETLKKILTDIDRNIDLKDESIKLKLGELFEEIDILAKEGDFLNAVLKTSNLENFAGISKGIIEIEEFLKEHIPLSETVGNKVTTALLEVKDLLSANDAVEYNRANDLIDDMKRLTDRSIGPVHDFDGKGHTGKEWEGGVLSVAFSPDGHYIASGAQDNTIRQWDAKTGEEIAVLAQGHTDSLSVAFSPDGHYIASGCRDGTIELWDTKTGMKVSGFYGKGHIDNVYSIAFRPDGHCIASGGMDKTVRLWSVETGREVPGFYGKGHTDNVFSVAFSPDGHYIASGGHDRNILLWDVKTGREVTGFDCKAHTYSIESIAFSPDGHYIASGSDVCTIELWDAKTGQKVPGFDCKERTGSIGGGVAFSPNGQYIASGNFDGIIRLRDAKTGREVDGFDGKGGGTCVVFSPNGQYIASGGHDRTIRLWALPIWTTTEAEQQRKEDQQREIEEGKRRTEEAQQRKEKEEQQLEEKWRLEEKRRKQEGLCLTCCEPIGFWGKMLSGLYCKEHKDGAQDEGKHKFISQVRFTADGDGIITDSVTGLQWFVGPDKNTKWEHANSFVNGLSIAGGGWRMPARKELEELYCEGLGDRNMPSAFKTTGWWVWSGELRSAFEAWGFYFFKREVSRTFGDDHNGRAFAVRP